MVALAKHTRIVHSAAAMLSILFAVAVFLSMAAAEILADWIFNEDSLRVQPMAATVLLFTDIGAIALLALSAARHTGRSR